MNGSLTKSVFDYPRPLFLLGLVGMGHDLFHVDLRLGFLHLYDCAVTGLLVPMADAFSLPYMLIGYEVNGLSNASHSYLLAF